MLLVRIHIPLRGCKTFSSQLSPSQFKGIGLGLGHAVSCLLSEQEAAFLLSAHESNLWVDLGHMFGRRLSLEISISGAVNTLAFANFSQALGRPAQGKAFKSYGHMTVDYSKQELSTNGETRAELGSKLGSVGKVLHQAFGGPQDVEGVVVGKDIYIVQTRPQPWVCVE